jgi:hypothetical protein
MECAGFEKLRDHAVEHLPGGEFANPTPHVVKASLQHHDLQMSGAQYGVEIDYWTILMVHCVLFIYMSRGHHTSECFILIFNLFFKMQSKTLRSKDGAKPCFIKLYMFIITFLLHSV